MAAFPLEQIQQGRTLGSLEFESFIVHMETDSQRCGVTCPRSLKHPVAESVFSPTPPQGLSHIFQLQSLLCPDSTGDFPGMKGRKKWLHRDSAFRPIDKAAPEKNSVTEIGAQDS